jgi:hypothetical protein
VLFTEDSLSLQRNKTRKKLATQIGLYVPSDVFEGVKSDFEAIRARIGEDLWHKLNQNYPKMPPTDRTELHRLISSRYPNLTGKSALHPSEITIYAYVRDRYTPFKSLNIYEKQNAEAISEVHRRVEKILASWRGED